MDKKDLLKREFLKGKVSRRDFNAGLMSMGLTAAAAGAFVSQTTKEAEAAEPVQGGYMRVACGSSHAGDTLDPAKIVGDIDITRSGLLYNRLIDFLPGQDLVGNLATSWEPNGDATVWTIELMDGVEFHNGKTLTADDVIYSFNEHIKEGSESPSKPLLEPIVEMKADGPNVLVITLNSGNADFPTLLGHDYHTSILPEGWVDGDDVVGTGPYSLAEFTPGRESVVDRFANYWKEDSAYVDTFITQGIPDNAARGNALRSGDIDMTLRVEARLASLMDQDPGVTVVSTPSGSFFIWDMMCDRAPTSDVNVRLALKHAVDRQYLVDNVLQGHGVVANDFPVNPAAPTYCREIPQHTYDPDKAKFYWDKTGLTSIELAVSNAGHANAVDSSVILQEQAAQAGIDVVLNRVPDDGYWSHTWMQQPFNVSGWNSRPTADLILTIAHACGGSWNETAWCNERFDELLVMGRVETDPEKRLAIYCEACTLLHDDGGAFIPFFSNYVEGVRTRIQNFHGSSAFALGAGWPYEEIWIDDSQT
jgi:peptide/nickel transport system substrate-binding protein